MLKIAMLKQINKETTFVLKDQEGNYVSSRSISYDEDTKQVSYTYAKFLVNGFYSSSTLEIAQAELDELKSLNKRFQLEKQFHILEIDMVKVMYEESEKTNMNIPRYPFISETFDFDDGKYFIWVIKDSKGNFARKDSVHKWDKKTWYYSAYKTFSPGCRGNKNLYNTERYLEILTKKAKEMGLDEKFHLEYVDIDEVIQEHENFTGENHIVIWKKVA
jgi:hypothetical protein